MIRAATPAEPARPSSGESANASPPKKTAVKPTHRANPNDDASGIWSPSAASPKTFELTVRAMARITIASARRVRCAASFSSAMRRLPNGVTATKSRLPRRASPASVDDRAKIDQSVTPSAKIAPYLKVM